MADSEEINTNQLLEIIKNLQETRKEIEKTELDENREVLHVDLTGEIFLVNVQSFFPFIYSENYIESCI